MKREKINSLIQLLDDPDEEIFSHVREELLGCGLEVIPELELFWERNDFEPTFMARVENLIHDIQFKSCQDGLKNWIATGGVSLLEGAIWVSRYQYPDLEEAPIREQIHAMGRRVWKELNNSLTAFEKVRIINHYFYQEFGFSGNRKSFHSPSNSFINNVLESKKGNPLSLSILYILLAEEIGEDVVGVNLPNHFVVGFLDKNNINEEVPLGFQDILFYINTFSKGMILQLSELESFLEQLKIEANPAYYAPCSHLDIIRRMLINLKTAFRKAGETDRENEIASLIACFQV